MKPNKKVRLSPPSRITDLILARRPSFDKVTFWVPRTLTRSQQLPLYEYRGGEVVISNQPMTKKSRWRQRITLNQPTDNQLLYLDEVTGGEYLINYVELALDYEAESDCMGECIADWLSQHQVQSHHGNKKASKFKNSYYYGPRAKKKKHDHEEEKVTRRNLVIYTRKTKDFTDTPCCRIELRLNGSDVVADHKIRTVHNLITYDHRGLWKAEIRLFQFDYQRYGKYSHYLWDEKIPKRSRPITKSFCDDRIKMNVWSRKGYAVVYTKILEWKMDEIRKAEKQEKENSTSDEMELQVDVDDSKSETQRLLRMIEPDFVLTAQEINDYCKFPELPNREYVSSFDKDFARIALKHRVKSGDADVRYGTDKIRRCFIEIDNTLFLPDNE